jgi:DNA polymerase
MRLKPDAPMSGGVDALSSQQRRTLDLLGIGVWRDRARVIDREPQQHAVAPVATTRDADWSSLQAEVASCVQCPLHAGRTQTVFGVGDRNASWMIIGEAPGAEEDRQGEPFVGRAGQLLNEMLRAVGLARSEVYIANILKCRPPQNRDPRADEIEACSAYLQRQVELVGPGLVLAVGRIAAQALLADDSPVGRLRGRVYRYGPADMKRKAWADLCLARQTLRESIG